MSKWMMKLLKGHILRPIKSYKSSIHAEWAKEQMSDSFINICSFYLFFPHQKSASAFLYPASVDKLPLVWNIAAPQGRLAHTSLPA